MEYVYTYINYRFKFEFKDYSGQYYGIPITIQTIEEAGSDKYAYRQALESFAHHIQFIKDFIAPDTLTIKLTKEVKEIK